MNFYKVTIFGANIECANYDVKANALSGNCLTQISFIVTNSSNTEAQTDSYINSLNTGISDMLAWLTPP